MQGNSNNQVNQEIFTFSAYFFNQFNSFPSESHPHSLSKSNSSQRQYLIAQIIQKTKSIEKLRKNYQDKQNQLSDLRKLLLMVSNENNQETEKINKEIQEMEALIISYRAAMKVINAGSLQACGAYWKIYCA